MVQSPPKTDALSTEASDQIVEAAADSTGLETSAASVHFLAASGRKRRRFVKLSMVIICGLLMPAALDVDFGPSSDLKQGYRLIAKASKVFTPRTLYADSGYDSEEWHRQCWEDWGTMSCAPPVVRARSGQVGGTYRWMMTEKWPDYGKRWDIETANSAMKRTLGSTLRSTLRHRAQARSRTPRPRLRHQGVGKISRVRVFSAEHRARPNTNGRPGTIYERDFGRTVGTNGRGQPTSRVRVVVNPDGTIKTLFPF